MATHHHNLRGSSLRNNQENVVLNGKAALTSGRNGGRAVLGEITNNAPIFSSLNHPIPAKKAMKSQGFTIYEDVENCQEMSGSSNMQLGNVKNSFGGAAAGSTSVSSFSSAASAASTSSIGFRKVCSSMVIAPPQAQENKSRFPLREVVRSSPLKRTASESQHGLKFHSSENKNGVNGTVFPAPPQLPLPPKKIENVVTRKTIDEEDGAIQEDDSGNSMSEFWADKVAKLPTVMKEDLLPSYHDYRAGLDHSISSETTQEDENEECPMVLDQSINDEQQQLLEKQSEAAWRVPPINFSQVVDATEYTYDILKYLKDNENKLMPKWNYMTKQPDITFMMRSILVDWLVEVGEEYKLCTESLYLAVNYIDRFLSYMSVQRAKLQLVGTACMFIAAKYEEIYPPDVTEFTYITDDTYNKKQVLRMEHLVLKVLGFDLTVPTAYFFVNQFSNLSKCPDEVTFLAQYLSELTLLDAERYLCYTPSIIGASAIALARHTCQVPAWPEEMVKITGYTVEKFQSCLVSLHQTFTDAPKSAQQAMREKYKQDKYLHVSELVPAPISSQ